jgi:hypothetical protein
VGRSDWAHRVGTTVVVTALVLAGLLAPGARATYATLPLGEDGRFITNLSAPVLSPGGAGTISFQVADPLTADLESTQIIVGLYAFNAYPGNATQLVPQGSLTLGSGAPNGGNVDLLLGAVVPGAPVPVEIPVASSPSAPSGTYALRISLYFDVNGTSYRLASRGEFTDAQWAAATAGPNGTSTLNLTTLNVSGIVPETAVLVRSNPYPLALDVILGVALLLAAAGGFYAFRRTSKSRSGATAADDRSHAPTALGKSRKRDGD